MRFFTFIILSALLLLQCDANPAPQAATEKTEPAEQIDSATGAPIRQPNNWIDRTCELVSEADIARLFGIDPQNAVLNNRGLPGKSYCVHTWMRPNWQQIESDNAKPGATYREFKNMLAVEVINYGTSTVCREQLELLRREQADVFKEEVPNLGEGALWSDAGTRLMVRKGHLMLHITLDHQDNPHDNLPKAREVAETALAKM